MQARPVGEGGMKERPVGVRLRAWLAVAVWLALRSSTVLAVSVPSKPLGFVYKAVPPKPDAVVVEAFFDPLCPDSRDAWPPLRITFERFFPHVSVVVHLLPLPYHDNAFAVSRALTAVDNINSSLTYPLLEKFFEHQEMFSGEATTSMTGRSITKHILNFAGTFVGRNKLHELQSAFADFATNMATRYSFKYSCGRGVMGTPTFFVDGSELDVGKWRSLIHQLISAN